MFKYDMYKDKHKQQKTQTRTFTRGNTEDRRQGHHNSLEPITVGPWCMHTNKGLTIRQKTQHQLQHIIQSRSNTSVHGSTSSRGALHIKHTDFHVLGSFIS